MTAIDVVTTISATSSSGIRGMMGHDLRWWRDIANVAMVWGLIVGVTGGAAVVVGTVLILKWDAEIKAHDDRVFEAYKVEVAGKVADAKTAGITAGLAAGRAQTDIDAAQIELEKQKALTAQAELETERLKKEVQWRVLSPQTRLTLTEELAKHPGVVNIRFVAGDPEAFFFAAQFSKIFLEAGWTQYGGGVSNSNTLPMEIIIPDRPFSNPAVIRHAFTEAGIKFSSHPLLQTSWSGAADFPQAPLIMIGIRTPTVLLHQ